MKPKIIFAILIASTLAACGGGGNGSNTSGTDSGGGNGSNTSGTDSGGASVMATACTIANNHPLIAVALTGRAGTAQFSSGGTTLAYSGDLSGTLSLVRDANAPAPLNKVCMDSKGNSSTSMRTVMQSNGVLGVSHTAVNGVDQPVLLMDTTALAPNTNLGALQGTYNLLGYSQKGTGSAPAPDRMSYATITFDNSGKWSICENNSACSTATVTGTFAAHSGSSYAFDLSSGGLVRGTAFMVVAGGNRILVVTENNTDAGGVTGMGIGVPQTTWNPVAGSYVLNTTDGTQNTIKIESPQYLIVEKQDQSQNKAFTVNTSSTGIATVNASDGTNYLIASPTGLLVIGDNGNNTGNNFANGAAFFSFGVMP
jgi:hypothetical protein